jgi:hypothetical protein
VWLIVTSALAIEPGQLEVLVERASEEMHWFEATALSVEYIRCEIGVPVDGEGETWVACAFPAGPMPRTQVPRELAGAARQARQAMREREEPVSDLRLHYVATERRLWICDQRLLPSRLWSTGRTVLGEAGGRLHPVESAGASGGGESLLGCTGRRVLLGSFVSDLAFGSSPADQQRLDALTEVLTGDHEALSPTPTSPSRRHTVPSSFVMQQGRPVPGGGMFGLELPAEGTVGVRVTWTLLGPDGPVEANTLLVSGLPEDWSELAGPVVPEGQRAVGTLEVFATDVPPGPHWSPEGRGFERLHTATLLEHTP